MADAAAVEGHETNHKNPVFKECFNTNPLEASAAKNIGKHLFKNFEEQSLSLTKKHFAGIAFVLTVLLFAIFLRYLPIVVSGQLVGMSPTRVINSGFMAVTVSMTLAILLAILIKREYVQAQMATLKKFRHLLFLMVKRDFITRYRRSVLGILWSMLNPLLTMTVLVIVFSFLFRFDIPHFAVYVLSGQIIFGLFSESTNQAMNSILVNAGVIKRVYVPKYIFPVSKVVSSLMNFGFAFVAFLLVATATRAPFHWTIVLIPIPVMFTFMFALGVGMLLSSMAVFFRDLQHLYSVTLTAWMFFTPIIYPVTILPERVFHLMHLNPLFHYVSYFRALALDGTFPGLWENVICLGFAMFSVCAGLYATMANQDKYILYI